MQVDSADNQTKEEPMAKGNRNQEREKKKPKKEKPKVTPGAPRQGS